MYGANGWVLHHNTDIWRITGAVDKGSFGYVAQWWCNGFADIFGSVIYTPEMWNSCVLSIRY